MNEPAPPICSICIANYNGAGMLVDCLESVLSQSEAIPIEVIVHDDASTDGSLALLQRYAHVVVIASAENVGFCIANNRMVARARGEFVLLLNNDAALYPDALTTLLDAARRQTPQGILTLPQYDWQTAVLVDRGCLLDPFYNPVPNLEPTRQSVAMVPGACLFVSRAVWNELGGFPEWFESIGEDLYLCCQARLRGLPVWVTPGSGYRHRQGASFGGNRVDAGRLSTTYQRRRLSERNKTFALVIFTPTLIVWLLLMIHLTLLTVEGAVLALIRRDRKIFSEIYGGVFTSLMHERKRVGKFRTATQLVRIATVAGFFACFTLFPRKLAMLRRYGLPEIKQR